MTNAAALGEGAREPAPEPGEGGGEARQEQGRGVQVDPIKPTLKAPGT